MKTIIVLHEDRYSDDYTKVHSIYQVNRKDFNIELEFNKYMVKFCNERGCDLYLDMGFPSNGAGCIRFLSDKNSTKVRTPERKLYNEVFDKFRKKELTILYFIEEVLKAEKLPFTEHYIL